MTRHCGVKILHSGSSSCPKPHSKQSARPSSVQSCALVAWDWQRPNLLFWGKTDSQHRGSKIVCAAHVKPLFAEHSRSRCWSKTHVLFVPDQVQERIETCTCFPVFYHPFRLRYIFSASWGKEDSRESCPHRPCRWLLRLQVPMLSGTRTMASTLGIQQMLMPACVMLVRNQIEKAQ